MINLEVKCVSKSERLEGENFVCDVTFQPAVQQAQYNAGAAIGTPNAPNPNQPEQEAQSTKPMLSGTITVQVRNTEEAQGYTVGQSYSLAVGGAVQTTSKK